MLFILAILLQCALTLGIGLIIAPLVVFFRDLERAVKLVLRFLFYASPIVYGLHDLRHLGLDMLAAFNPLAGIFSLYRAAFFPEQLDWFAVAISAGMSRPSSRRRRPDVPPQHPRRAEGDLMATQIEDARIGPGMRVEGVGIRFKRNRTARRNFKDLFAGRRRRTRPGEFWALRDVSFSVAPGEAIGVVGRNGQGKSTLLKLVAQVMLPDEGEVRCRGRRRAAHRDHRRLRQRPHGARQRLPHGRPARHVASARSTSATTRSSSSPSSRTSPRPRTSTSRAA